MKINPLFYLAFGGLNALLFISHVTDGDLLAYVNGIAAVLLLLIYVEERLKQYSQWLRDRLVEKTGEGES